MNPQKKRLEQLKARREAQEAAEKQQLQIHNSKSKKKMTSGEAVTPEETNVKMSAESVDYEYSVEEDYEDEEYKSAKNEIVNKLLIEEKRLKKSARLAVENEKKLNSVLEEFNKRFDDFESLLDQMLEEVAGYKKNSMVTYTTMLESNSEVMELVNSLSIMSVFEIMACDPLINSLTS
ncbi:Protein CBG21494 [Caenorhabditis briggsae]|uniref:Protein CBG21494 n=1 Tax=Caenorhabditis briggsae TaxID=6238 RepID=A8Y059_CAEBR|nr:Protein CBG21494 [Caenorhabditis briggsae]CAP38277.2 Protein CBG21494 [Caenorhabditis briggsae]